MDERRPMNRFLVASLVIGIAAGCGTTGSSASPGESRPTQPTDGTPPLGPARNGVIALGKDGDIVVADRPGGDLRPLVAGPEDDRSPVFSPDGTRLVFLRDTELGSFLMVADADGTNVATISPEPSETYGWPWSFAPDGRSLMTIARIDGAYRVVIRPVDPAAALTVLDIRLPGVGSLIRQSGPPSYHPTNPQEILVVAQLEPGELSGFYPRGIYVYDLATRGIRTILELADDHYPTDVAWLPDGAHIIYTSSVSRVVAADGSGDHAVDALRDRVSPLSNDGTRVVAERDVEGEQTGRPVIVPINGDGEPVALACGPGTDIECPTPPTDWIWSPDDSMLIGTLHDDLTPYLLVDAHTGEVTELDWVGVGTPAWQRIAP
jgi:Tol biopolymer transport system component